MPFRDLPARLRLYLLAHLVVVPPVLYAAMAWPAPKDAWLVAALVLFTLLFSTWKVELTVGEGRMTPVFATVCLAMLLEGGQAAILCSAVGGLATTFIRPPKAGWKVEFLHPRLYYAWFNLASTALAGAGAALAYYLTLPLTPRNGFDAVTALAAFALLYYLANTMGVALAIALQQGQRWSKVWQQNFLWTAPGFFASAAAGLGIEAAHAWIGGWSLLFLPPLYLIYYSYKLYLDRLRLFADQVKQDTARIQQLSNLNEALVASLKRTTEAAAQAGRSGIHRARHYALTLAKTVGMSPQEQEALAAAALLHDTGLGISDFGFRISDCPDPDLQRLDPSDPNPKSEIRDPKSEVEGLPAMLVEVVLAQHERWDGLGCPRRLKGDQIPVGGRILAIAGTFALLTSERPYRRALAPEEALSALREGAGQQFDPYLVRIFEERFPQAEREMVRQAA